MNGGRVHPIGPRRRRHRPQTGAAPVFISYRSNDEPWAALCLHQELSARFGPQSVFIDCVSIVAGEDYRRCLPEAVARSVVVLAVIGRRWMTAARGRGQDWMRVEIALATAAGVRIVPVLVEDAQPPAVHELPDDIACLAHRQYVRLRHRDSRRDIANIIDSLSIQANILPSRTADEAVR